MKCRKKGTGEEVAVKVVKNKAAYFNQVPKREWKYNEKPDGRTNFFFLQGFMEVKILEHMNKHYDPSSRYSVRLLDYFIFNRHLCMFVLQNIFPPTLTFLLTSFSGFLSC